MRTRLTSVMVILIVLLCCNAASLASKRHWIKGRIDAYRPADRMQVVSSVPNKELVLFQVEGTNRELLKIVYVHQGFSDLKGDVLSGTQGISISARRDSSCDQTLGAFEKEAPAVKLEGGSSASTDRIVFASSTTKPAESYRLKCYVLEQWAPLNPKAQ